MDEEISGKKFHEILPGLSVALEATFNSGENLKYNPSFCFPGLVYRSPEGLVTRAYHPANVRKVDIGIEISFLPWIENEAEFFRLCLRAQKSAVTGVKFGRFGEENPFGFKPEKPYIRS